MASIAKLIGLATILFLSGCAALPYTPEVTAMVGPKRVNSNVQEVALTVMVVQRFGKRGHGVCGWVHGSDPQHGKPFNDDPEDDFDTLGCGARFGGKRK